MAIRFSSALLKLCMGSMDAVFAALLVPPMANEKSRRRAIPNLSPGIGAENDRAL